MKKAGENLSFNVQIFIFFPDLQKSLIFKIYTQRVQSNFIQFSKVESLKKINQ